MRYQRLRNTRMGTSQWHITIGDCGGRPRSVTMELLMLKAQIILGVCKEEDNSIIWKQRALQSNRQLPPPKKCIFALALAATASCDAVTLLIFILWWPCLDWKQTNWCCWESLHRTFFCNFSTIVWALSWTNNILSGSVALILICLLKFPLSWSC